MTKELRATVWANAFIEFRKGTLSLEAGNLADHVLAEFDKRFPVAVEGQPVPTPYVPDVTAAIEEQAPPPTLL